MRNNLILNTDSYKASHWLQYPPKTTKVFSYIESRGSAGDKNVYGDPALPRSMPETVFFGLQMFLKEYLSEPIIQADIEEAEAVFTAHGEPFNREGWQYILDEYAGYMPVEIKAVPEGTVVPTKNVLVTVENTDDKCFWLTSYIETALLRAIWYPTTVSTISWRIKNLIRNYLQETADSTEGIGFKLHDFGARGVSSKESSGIGGLAHLVNFMGTDTVEALLYAKRYYGEDMAGFSIPAAEHSSITTWGKDGEVDAYRNMLTQFAKPGSLVAVVSDSYDIVKATKEIWGGVLKQEVIDSGATVIIRPDSGNPAKVVVQVLKAAAESFGTTTNSKGYKVLNTVRVIQGDGINEESIEEILDNMESNGFSAENIAFGMGGALLQQMDRDTFKFAMKACAAEVDGKWIDVFKDPVTDPGKASKKGRVQLLRNKNGKYRTAPETNKLRCETAVLETVFINGEIVKEYTFAEVRENAEG